MTTNKILLAGLIGGVVAFILGFLFYGMILSDFFVSNMGSATGVIRGDDEMQWGPMIIGHLAYGLLFAVIFGRWANISTFVTGAKAGAVIGFLVSLAHAMIQLGSTHLSNMTGTLADVGVGTLLSAGTAGVVGWFLGRGQ
ncbi:MAG: hypothetical protein IPM36_15615 [Lewinellaceae bacterium]|nr:hypothetical protein [Lewinellaceae bacterium]